MGTYTVIPQSTFDEMQLDAGILLTDFDPSNPEVVDSNILCATTGGINIVAEPSYSDLGEDVDNVPANMKELKHLDSWDCRFETTGLGTSPELIKKALGCADIDGSNESKIVPRKDLDQDDFADLWWVGDKADGGFVAVKLINALSTAGFSLQTTKDGKGQTSLTFTGHVSIDAQNVVPIEFYSIDSGENVNPSIELNKHVAKVKVGSTVTLTAKTIPASQSVTWSSGTTAKAEVSNGVVTGAGIGSSIITASITVDGVVYNDTCTVIVEAAS